MKRISFLALLMVFLPLVAFLQPVGYYNGTEGLQGNDLKMKLHEIIRGHTSLSYYFSKYVIYYADADPVVPGNVILVYTGRSQNGLNYGSGDLINREHVWAKSHGNFSGVLPMDSDVHNLKPADASVNSSRSNMDFDWSLYWHAEATECKFTPGTSWEPRDAVKGDIARIIFYMDARYKWTNGELNLTVVDKVNTYPYPEHGKLSALLDWNPMDPPDQFEHNRNNVIYRFQKNRNPFIDNPHFVELIWGNGSLPDYTIGNIEISDPQPPSFQKVTVSGTISPNPASGDVQLFWGNVFNSLTENVPMVLIDGKWHGEIPGHAQESIVYFSIRASEGSNKISWSPTYSIRVAASFDGDITPITAIQGTGSSSPYENQILTTTGVVTAFYLNGYYIQAGNGPRTGLYVYHPNFPIPSIGDSIVITGQVKEYYGLTEIANPSMYKLIKTDRTVPAPEVITASQIGEDWESVLVRIHDATCTYSTHWNNSGMWRVNDGTGQANVHNNDVFEFSPVLNSEYTVTGPLTYDNSQWKIELRSLADVTDPTSVADLPSIQRLQVYPNPAADHIIIQLPGNRDRNAVVRIIDVLGNEMFSSTVDFHQTSMNIDLGMINLNDGFYIVVYTDDKSVASERLIFRKN